MYPRRFFLSLSSLVLLLAITGAATAQDWPRWSSPEEAGFTSEAVAEAESIWNALPDAPNSSFLLVYKGRVLTSFGSETYPYWCHSMRKSFLSALYGIHVKKKNLDLDMTMAELEIDDLTPLTATEKQARVGDLLKARSGVYIEAACEAQSMKDARPERGSHLPGTFWYYNNWDFNALGTIFREQTGRDIFEEFNSKIARKVGMQDFVSDSCQYTYEQQLSMHPCYTFRMSTRDRARFGQLFLQNGRWGDRQIIPPAWLEESTRAHSATGVPGRGYGYMWWTYEPDFFELIFSDRRLHHLRVYAASGYGGQAIMVFPDQDLVVVFSADVYAGADLDILETAPILQALLTSPQIIDLASLRVKAKPTAANRGDQLRLVVKINNKSPTGSRATRVDFYLSPERSVGAEAVWLGEAALDELAAGKRKNARLKTSVPENLEPGRYHLIAVVDGEKSNYDLRRSNNMVVAKQRIRVAE
jgi:CubicO group peptidase (beta-lactamase class C family)